MIKVTDGIKATFKAIKATTPLTEADATLTIDLSGLTPDTLTSLIRALENAAGSAGSRRDTAGCTTLYDAASNVEFYALMTSVE